MKDDSNENALHEQLALLLKQDLNRSTLETSNITIQPLKGWFGSQKTEKIKSWNTKLFELNDLQFKIMKRSFQNKEHYQTLKNQPPINFDPKRKFNDKYFRKSNKIPLIYQDESISTKKKNFKGTVWM